MKVVGLGSLRTSLMEQEQKVDDVLLSVITGEKTSIATETNIVWE